jgi:hypothetical protein
MKKTLALIIGSVIVIAFLAVFLASDEGAPVTTPIDTATTTAVVATTTLEKTELDLNEWKLFEETDLFSEGSEFWYPAEWVVHGEGGSVRGSGRDFFDRRSEVGIKKQNGEFISSSDIANDSVFHILFYSTDSNQLAPAVSGGSTQKLKFLENKTTKEDITISDRPARKIIRHYELKDTNEVMTDYILVLNNINGAYHRVEFSIKDTRYSNTEEIFNEIIARMILGPIPEEDQQVIPIPTECHTVDRPDYCPEVHPSHNE